MIFAFTINLETFPKAHIHKVNYFYFFYFNNQPTFVSIIYFKLMFLIWAGIESIQNLHFLIKTIMYAHEEQVKTVMYS